MPTASPDLLEGVSVLEISGRIAGRYCGRLLGGLGAQVTRVRMPLAAYAVDGVAPALGAAFALGKREVGPDDAEAAELARTVDLVIVDVLHEDAHDGGATTIARRLLAARSPTDPVIEITQFSAADGGVTRPGAPLLSSAASGASWSIGAPDREPLSLPFDLPDAMAGAEAAAAAVVTQIHRDAGSDQCARIQVAVADVVAYYVGQIVANFAPVGRPWHRDGPGASQSGGSYPAAIFTCTDGAVAIMCRQSSEWVALINAMGNPPWSERAEIRDSRLVARFHAAEVDPHVRAWIGGFTRDEMIALGRQFDFPIAPVRDVAESLADPQYHHRHFFRELPTASSEPARVPGTPFRLAAHGKPGNPSTRSLGASQRPLAGLRVLEFSWVWSGPALAAALGDLGADVLKVEHESRPDSARARGAATFPGQTAVGPPLERTSYFPNVNRGKRSVGINLTSEAARDLILRLVQECDIVVENMRPGALSRRGLGYAELSHVNPALVMVSMSVGGQDGPIGNVSGYAPVMSGLAGLEGLVGYRDGEPMGLFNLALSDPNAASHGLAAVLAAVRRQRLTGQGAWIDLSQMECVSSLLTEPLLEAQLTGGAHVPANGHSSFWPHGHFRCFGDDAWLAVAVRTEAERDRLVELLGFGGDDAPALTTALSAWVGQRTREDAAQLLTDAGLPAAPVRTYEDLQLIRRTSATVLTHPYSPEQIVGAIPWRIGDTELLPLMRGPLLGEHTDEVLRDLVGIDDTEIEALRRDGVLSPAPVASAAPQTSR